VFLPRRLPMARLAQLFLDPAPLPAAAARELGLVDEVADDPRAAAVERATAIARKTSPAAIAETKRLLLTLALPRLDEQLAHAAAVNAAQRVHRECRRGVASLLAGKGFPSWLDGDPPPS
jgi:enoyl-CoA hydratase/carnithine racemase